MHIQQGLRESEEAHKRYQEALKQTVSIIDGNQNELMGQLGGQNAPKTGGDADKRDAIQLEPVPAQKETLELSEDAFIKEDL